MRRAGSRRKQPHPSRHPGQRALDWTRWRRWSNAEWEALLNALGGDWSDEAVAAMAEQPQAFVRRCMATLEQLRKRPDAVPEAARRGAVATVVAALRGTQALHRLQPLAAATLLAAAARTLDAWYEVGALAGHPELRRAVARQAPALLDWLGLPQPAEGSEGAVVVAMRKTHLAAGTFAACLLQRACNDGDAACRSAVVDAALDNDHARLKGFAAALIAAAAGSSGSSDGGSEGLEEGRRVMGNTLLSAMVALCTLDERLPEMVERCGLGGIGKAVEGKRAGVQLSMVPAE